MTPPVTEPMKRINPSEVPALFAKHQIKPAQGYFYTTLDVGYGPICIACLCGIEAIDKVGRDAVDSAIDDCWTYGDILEVLAEQAALDEIYTRGLNDGWEDTGSHNRFLRYRQYTDGRSDGRAAYDACAAAGTL